ncbi:MAG: hypothetical protein ACT4OT_11330 [Acidobacteriota bacterium]
MRNSFSTHEIVTIAVYLLGGESSPIHTEDIAVKANEIAPGRFTWRKYPEQIDIEIVRVCLSNAKKPQNGKYLAGTGKDGWLLTERGHAFAREQARQLEGLDLSKIRHTASERQWINRERGRMLASDVLSKFQLNKSVTLQEAEAFFRLDDYVRGEARERRILRVVNTFGRDPQLGTIVTKLAKKIRKKKEVRNGSS